MSCVQRLSRQLLISLATSACQLGVACAQATAEVVLRYVPLCCAQPPARLSTCPLHFFPLLFPAPLPRQSVLVPCVPHGPHNHSGKSPVYRGRLRDQHPPSLVESACTPLSGVSCTFCQVSCTLSPNFVRSRSVSRHVLLRPSNIYNHLAESSGPRGSPCSKPAPPGKNVFSSVTPASHLVIHDAPTVQPGG